MLRLINIFFITFMITGISFAGDTDSLEFELLKTSNKKQKVDLLNKLLDAYDYSDSVKYLSRAHEAIHLSGEIKYEFGLALSHKNLGDFYQRQYKIDSALNHYNMALSLFRSMTYDELTGETLYKIGTLFFATSNYQAALKYTNESLEIFQILDNKKRLASVHSLLCDIKSIMGFKESAIENCRISLDLYETLELSDGKASLLNSIGNIYLDIGQHEKSEQYFNQALFIARSKNDPYTTATSLSNLGHMYLEKGAYEEAILYFNRAMEIDHQQKDIAGLGYSYYNLGMAHMKLGNYNEAMNQLEQSLSYAGQSIDLELQAKVYSEIGNLHSEMGQYQDAIGFLKKSMGIAQRIDSDPILQTIYNNLAKYYDRLGDQENALIYFKLYMLHRQEMYAHQSALKIAEAEALYDLEKKERQIQLLRSENRIKDLEAAEKNMMNIWLITGLVFVFGFSVVIYRQYRLQNKANRILQEQKEAINRQKGEISSQRDDIEKTNHILADKNRQITDSIEYARRIQFSLLPGAALLKDHFRESFILYMPRDIVSGDFYWMSKKSDHIIVAVVDCTGHGVPGAFMTVLANSLLNQISMDYKDWEHPEKILDMLDKKIVENLNQHGITLSAFEGMDIALCIINYKTRELNFAGAKMPLYHVRDGDLDQLKGDRFSIGGNDVKEKKFTNKSIKLRENDMIYMATDGFQDQFGGEKGKKFMKLHFRNFLKTLSGKPAEEQHDQLRSVFNEWKGYNVQTDDVLVFGIRI